MSTAFRSVPRSRRPSSPRRLSPNPTPSAVAGRSSRRRPSLAVLPSTPSGNTVRRLPTPSAIPLWVRLLIQVQRGSMVVTFVLVIAALIIYGSTVYTQQLWSRDYRKLKTLQRNERELVATGEGLKNQIAQQAERPGSGLVPQTPDSTIFLEPAPIPQTPTTKPSVPKADPTPDTPLGY